MTTDQKPNVIPLGQQAQQQGAGAMVAVESSRAIQEIQASLVIAKQFPRDEVVVMQKIRAACMRPALAEAAVYIYARGGTDITGASIRLAEAIARLWGNLDFGWRELERRGNVSLVQAYAWDKETNTRSEQTFEVKHVRNTKKGSYTLTDERDIYELLANQASRRVRARILALVPGDVVEEALAECERTIGNAVTSEKVEALLNAFKAYHVNTAMIEARIQRNISAMQSANLIDLRKVYNSLRDGMSTVSTWFDLSLSDQVPEAEAITEKNSLDSFKEKHQEAGAAIDLTYGGQYNPATGEINGDAE